MEREVLVVIKSTKVSGMITLKVKSSGLVGSNINIQTVENPVAKM